MKIKEFVLNLLNKLYVKDFRCIVCHREIPSGSKYSMCDKCRQNLPTIKNPCTKCGGDISIAGVCTNCKSNMPTTKTCITKKSWSFTRKAASICSLPACL